MFLRCVSRACWFGDASLGLQDARLPCASQAGFAHACYERHVLTRSFWCPPRCLPPYLIVLVSWRCVCRCVHRIWLFYANPYAYFNASVLRNLLPDMTFTCTAEERAVFPLPPDFASCSAIPDSATYVDVTLPSGEAGCSFCPIPTGDTVLDLFTVLDVNKWVCIAALCGFVLVARIATALALKFTKHMTR